MTFRGSRRGPGSTRSSRRTESQIPDPDLQLRRDIRDPKGPGLGVERVLLLGAFAPLIGRFMRPQEISQR